MQREMHRCSYPSVENRVRRLKEPSQLQDGCVVCHQGASETLGLCTLKATPRVLSSMTEWDSNSASVGAYWLSRWEQRNDSPELVKYRNQHGWEALGCNKLHTHHKCAKPYFCIACICNDLPTGCFKVVAKANFKYPLT